MTFSPSNVFALFVLSAPGVGAVEAPPVVSLLSEQFRAGAIASPFLRTCGSVEVRPGLMVSRPLGGWRRSGVTVGPVPVAAGPLRIRYDFRPLRLHAQSQQFASELPSTHWYMAYVADDGRLRCHTRKDGKWELRATSKTSVKTGVWYRADIDLARTHIRFRFSARDSGKLLLDTGTLLLDDLGGKTVFSLADECPDAGPNSTEWANLVISTTGADIAARWRNALADIERERREQAQREEQLAALRAAGIALIPTPREVRLGGGGCVVHPGAAIVVEKNVPAEAVRAVRDVLQERLPAPPPGAEEPSGARIVLTLPPAEPKAQWKSAQGYRLIVNTGGVRVEALARPGFFYAAQTLAQLAGPGGRVPGVEIRDWPAIPNRLVMIAVSQGGFQVIDVAYWKRLIRELAAVKINAIMPYFEGGTFDYTKYPFLCRKGEGGFTVEKGRILSEYAWEHGIEMVPQQESLGHSGAILGHNELRHLREAGGTFCSSKPEVFAFLGDLYDDLVRAFPHARSIHVGGDEFHHNFAKCPLCKARAAVLGKDGLYAEHLAKLQRMLARRHRRMMIWWHERGYTESAADRIDKAITVFDWHYGNQRDYPSLDRLMKLGFTNTWATPAVTRYYNRGGDDWHATFGNIRGFLRAGVRRGVPGECTCTWVHGLWGGRNLFELNLYGLLFSADCAWNPMMASESDFQRKFPQHWFGLRGKDLEDETRRAVHEPYGVPAEQKFWRDNRILEPILGEPPVATLSRLQKHPELPVQAQELLRFCARADRQLADWKARAVRNRRTLDFLMHDVHIHRAAARRLLVIADFRAWCEKRGGPPPKPLLDGLRKLDNDYREIERMFQRSILEAGGGSPGWGSMASGIIRFRVSPGREGIEKLLRRLAPLDAPPASPEKWLKQ